MPWPTPTLADLAERTFRAFAANLKGSDSRLWPNNVHVAAKVIAAAAHECMAFQDFISQQIVATTASAEFLEKHAAARGLARLPPNYASGSVDMTGDALQPIPAGAILQGAAGVQYEITAPATTDGSGDATVTVRALLPGSAGNAAAGVALNLTAAIDRINTEAAVNAGGIGQGSDTESDEGLRSRLLFLMRNPPMGGARHDYVTWVRGFNPAITRVFVDPITASNGRDTIGIWFLMDDTYTNGIPLTADVNAVAAYLDTVRPAGAVIEVAAPTPVNVDVTIGSLSLDTTAVRAAILTELQALFRRDVRVSTETEPFKLWRSKIIEAISIATGEDHHLISAPATDALYTAGQLPVLDDLTFT